MNTETKQLGGSESYKRFDYRYYLLFKVLALTFLILIPVLCLNIQFAKAFSMLLSADRSDYISSETHNLSLDLNNPDAAIVLDAYLAIKLPDGSMLFIKRDSVTGVNSFFPGNPNDPSTWTPYLTNINIPSGLNINGFQLFQHTFSGTEPFGTYTWYMAFTTPGTKNVIGGLGTTLFIFDSISNLFVGNWTGSWLDTVFNVDGDFQITVTRNTNTLNATGSIELGSIPLPDDSGAAIGTISNNGNTVDFTFEANANSLGSGTGMINSRNISGTGTSVFGPFSFNGTLNNNEVTGTFVFTTGGAGVATATKN